jgi:hypothetical protein
VRRSAATEPTARPLESADVTGLLKPWRRTAIFVADGTRQQPWRNTHGHRKKVDRSDACSPTAGSEWSLVHLIDNARY